MLARAAEERNWHMEDEHVRELELEAKELELANLRQREVRNILSGVICNVPNGVMFATLHCTLAFLPHASMF